MRSAEQVYENGDRVYYKREGRERWLGPAIVVFQDGKVVFVRHGGIFVHVSPNRLNKIHTTQNQNESKPSGLQEHERVRKADCGRDETNNLGSLVQPEISEECGEIHEAALNGPEYRNAKRANDS